MLVRSFSSNVQSQQGEIERQSATGTVSVALKSGRQTVPVVDVPLKISLQIKNNQGRRDLTCGWWDHAEEAVVTADCSATYAEGSISCLCSHLTDFMGVYKNKIVDYVKKGNWEYITAPEYTKPYYLNISFYFIIV